MKTKQINDERTKKGIAQNLAPMYPVLLILTITLLLAKIVLRIHPLMYLFEIIALILSLSYYVITIAKKNMLFVKENDEAIINIKNSAKHNSYMLHMYTLILGMGIISASAYIYPTFEDLLIVVLSAYIPLFIGVIPYSFANKKSHKQGFMVAWNSEKSKTTTLKRLKLWCTIQAICSGVIIILTCLYVTIFNYTPPSPSLFSLIETMSIVFFVYSFMYFPIKKGMLKSEEIANKEAQLAEISIEDEHV
ncbi:MAG: hypothetical protein FWH37_06865 [Candidatus Bathyarchaeota archaeon]|nr:hypothetical protein [Candidatus Termiticorpusculum sp.]